MVLLRVSVKFGKAGPGTRVGWDLWERTESSILAYGSARSPGSSAQDSKDLEFPTAEARRLGEIRAGKSRDENALVT